MPPPIVTKSYIHVPSCNLVKCNLNFSVCFQFWFISAGCLVGCHYIVILIELNCYFCLPSDHWQHRQCTHLPSSWLVWIPCRVSNSSMSFLIFCGSVVQYYLICFFSICSQLLLYAENMFYHITQLSEDRDNCVGVSTMCEISVHVVTVLLRNSRIKHTDLSLLTSFHYSYAITRVHI